MSERHPYPPGTIVLKDADVSLADLRPQIVLALQSAAAIWGHFGVPLIVTSANDGRHSKTSLHYAGAAVDLRTKTLGEHKRTARGLLSGALLEDFDVLLENEGEPNEHMHVEYQPRRRY